MSKDPPIYNKLLFRGSENNDIRKYINEFYKDSQLVDFKKTNGIDGRKNYMNFYDYSKYKYIFEINGINGHRARTPFMFFMNRVLFLPIDDPNKLFFEVSKNPIKPNVHFIPYSLNELDTLEEKVKYLEEHPEEYKKIQENGFRYAMENLTFDKILDYMADAINN